MGKHFSPRIVTDGMVLCLDAANSDSYSTGTNWNDLSGNANNGTLGGGASYTNDALGSINFDGTDDIVTGVHNSQLDLTGNVTIECAFKKTGTRTDWVRVLGKGAASNRTYGLWYHDTNNYFLYQRYGTTNLDLIYTAPITTNAWYHVIGTSSGTSHSLYVNGGIVATSSGGSTFYSTTDPYRVGGFVGVNLYHLGNISCCRIYNRALTAIEVNQNFNALRGRYRV